MNFQKIKNIFNTQRIGYIINKENITVMGFMMILKF